MDAFELNKIAGAVLFALLVIFATRTITDIAFAPHKPEKPGFEVEVAEEAAPGAEKDKPAVPLPQRLAEASADKGQAVAKKCAACHTFDSGGANKVGPNLHNIVGKQIAAVSGFAYSEAMKNKGGNWDYEALDAYLRDPKGVVPGTKMAFVGVKRDDQRADLLLYLRSVTENPPPLPEPAAAPGQKAPPQETPGEQTPAQSAPAPDGKQQPPAQGQSQ